MGTDHIALIAHLMRRAGFGATPNGQNIQNAFSLMAANLGQLQQEVL